MTEQTYAVPNKDTANYREYTEWYQKVGELMSKVVAAQRDLFCAEQAEMNHRVHQRRYADFLSEGAKEVDFKNTDFHADITKAQDELKEMESQLAHARGRLQTAANAVISWVELEARVGKEEAERRGANNV